MLSAPASANSTETLALSLPVKQEAGGAQSEENGFDRLRGGLARRQTIYDLQTALFALRQIPDVCVGVNERGQTPQAGGVVVQMIILLQRRNPFGSGSAAKPPLEFLEEPGESGISREILVGQQRIHLGTDPEQSAHGGS